METTVIKVRCSEDRTTNASLFYEISAKGAEKYVDTVNGKPKEICANGETRGRQMSFDSHGALTTGQECGSTSPKDMKIQVSPYAYWN
ncbi:hypothetical protein O9992_09510 [Vibrio lentus]|nr:hypothetical protein [Vibrio lentus]